MSELVLNKIVIKAMAIVRTDVCVVVHKNSSRHETERKQRLDKQIEWI